jgi:hypothetical protein
MKLATGSWVAGKSTRSSKRCCSARFPVTFPEVFRLEGIKGDANSGMGADTRQPRTQDPPPPLIHSPCHASQSPCREAHRIVPLRADGAGHVLRRRWGRVQVGGHAGARDRSLCGPLVPLLLRLLLLLRGHVCRPAGAVYGAGVDVVLKHSGAPVLPVAILQHRRSRRPILVGLGRTPVRRAIRSPGRAQRQQKSSLEVRMRKSDVRRERLGTADVTADLRARRAAAVGRWHVASCRLAGPRTLSRSQNLSPLKLVGESARVPGSCQHVIRVGNRHAPLNKEGNHKAHSQSSSDFNHSRGPMSTHSFLP